MRFYVVMILLLFGISGNAKPGPSDPWGIGTGLESEEIADQVTKLGASWIRLTIYWNQAEPSKGRFDWRGLDEQIARAKRRGLKVNAVIHSTPSWANGGKGPEFPPHRSEDWTDFIRAVAERYSPRRRAAIQAYGMWNEPNVDKFWRGSRDEYIHKILIPGYQAFKKVNPIVLILAPETSHHWLEQPEWELKKIMQSASPYFDVIGLHYYPDADISFSDFLDKKVLPHRDRKDVWITEIGKEACSSVSKSERQQSDAYISFAKTLRERSWFTRIFPYRLWDPVDACGKDGNGFGLTYGKPIRERPAFQTYRQIAGPKNLISMNQSKHVIGETQDSQDD